MLFGGGTGFLGEERRFGFVFDLDSSLVLEGGEKGRREGEGAAYSDFEVDHFVCESGHLVVEAYAVFSHVLCCEDKVSLSFFLACHDLLVIRSYHLVVDVEGAARLNLRVLRQYSLLGECFAAGGMRTAK